MLFLLPGRVFPCALPHCQIPVCLQVSVTFKCHRFSEVLLKAVPPYLQLIRVLPPLGFHSTLLRAAIGSFYTAL